MKNTILSAILGLFLILFTASFVSAEISDKPECCKKEKKCCRKKNDCCGKDKECCKENKECCKEKTCCKMEDGAGATGQNEKTETVKACDKGSKKCCK